MTKKQSKCNIDFNSPVMSALLEDPTRSVLDIAKSLKTYRQRIWREKKKLEESGAIWGYTAIPDEFAFGHIIYMILMKLKPIDAKLAELIIQRQLKGEAKKQNVRVINIFYINGEFDFCVMVSAPDHATARRYFDSLRQIYSDYLLEKPVVVDVNMVLVREGKINPNITRLMDFVPL